MIDKIKYILGAIGAVIAFLFIRKCKENPPDLTASNQAIAQNNQALATEEQKREQIKKDTEEKKNETVSDKDIADFFNDRKS